MADGPLISIGMVVGQDADSGTLTVLMRTQGNVPGAVRIGYHGPADALRVKQAPMPGRGTWGVIAFPYGDIRNGIWLCSYYPGNFDAITASSASGSGTFDPFIDYESHFSGFWRMMTGSGWVSMQYADSSYFTAAPASGLAVPTRHVDTSGVRTRESLTFSQRVSGATPAPFLFGFVHASGTSITIDTSGNIAVSGVGTVAVSGAGTITVSGASTVNIGGATSVNVSGGVDKVNIGGSALSDHLVAAAKMAAAFSHTHTVNGVMGGGGSIQTTSASINASDIQVSWLNISAP